MAHAVYLGGSRALTSSKASVIAQVVRAVLSSGCAVHVGCAGGADALVIQTALQVSPLALSVFAIGGPGGVGYFGGSAFTQVCQAAQAGAFVAWWAGGPAHVPLRARLIQRSQAAFTGCAQAVFFFASPNSAGSLAVAAKAAASGLPVFAFCVGFSGPPAPLAGQVGQWAPVHPFSYYAVFSAPCWQWQPAQAQLF